MEFNDPTEAPPASERTVIRVGAYGGALAVLATLIGLLVWASGPKEKAPSPEPQAGPNGETRVLTLIDYQQSKETQVSGGVTTPIRVILSVVALIFAGATVTLRPRWVVSWLMAIGICLFAGFGFPTSWDTFRTIAFAFCGVGLLGAIFASASFKTRVVLASLAVFYHFGGIFNSIIKPPPYPEIATNVWTVAFRPYSEFAYLVNAYQFYSPDPGPASYLWFCIDYENLKDDPVQFEELQRDGEVPIRDNNNNLVYVPVKDKDGDLAGQPVYDAAGNVIFLPELDSHGNRIRRPVTDFEGNPIYLKHAIWFKTPRRPSQFKDPLGQSYYRRLSMTENASQTAQISPVDFEVLRVRREHGDREIPFDVNNTRYFRWPAEDVRSTTIPTYVRHIAHEFNIPGRPIRGIKVYRVEHVITEPRQFVKRELYPYDPISYYPYYMGDFNVDGELKSINDPMLYFLIPIIQNPRISAQEFASRDVRKMSLANYKKWFIDYVEKHAGCSHMKGELK